MAQSLKFTKDPNAVLDYYLDWGSWLPEGDAIIDSDWLPPDEPPNPPAVLTSGNSDSVTSVWLSGGDEGQVYAFVNRITTAAGRVMDRTVTFIMRQQ